MVHFGASETMEDMLCSWVANLGTIFCFELTNTSCHAQGLPGLHEPSTAHPILPRPLVAMCTLREFSPANGLPWGKETVV